MKSFFSESNKIVFSYPNYCGNSFGKHFACFLKDYHWYEK